MQNICPICHSPFDRRSPFKIYCGRRCQVKAQRIRDREYEGAKKLRDEQTRAQFFNVLHNPTLIELDMALAYHRMVGAEDGKATLVTGAFPDGFVPEEQFLMMRDPQGLGWLIVNDDNCVKEREFHAGRAAKAAVPQGAMLTQANLAGVSIKEIVESGPPTILQPVQPRPMDPEEARIRAAQAAGTKPYNPFSGEDYIYNANPQAAPDELGT